MMRQSGQMPHARIATGPYRSEASPAWACAYRGEDAVWARTAVLRVPAPLISRGLAELVPRVMPCGVGSLRLPHELSRTSSALPISRCCGTSSSRTGIRKRRRTQCPWRWRKSSSGGRQWNPRAYARGTPISNLIKSKQRGLQRIQERLAQRGDVSFEHDLDPGPPEPARDAREAGELSRRNWQHRGRRHDNREEAR